MNWQHQIEYIVSLNQITPELAPLYCVERHESKQELTQEWFESDWVRSSTGQPLQQRVNLYACYEWRRFRVWQSL